MLNSKPFQCLESFVPYSTMLASFRAHNPNVVTRAYIIHYDLEADDHAYLDRVAEKVGVDIELIQIPPYPFLLFKSRKRAALRARRTMSPIAYAKAFLDRVLPTNEKATICIDADIIIRGDMSNILRMELSTPVVAAANIPLKYHHQFNSGFMLVDLEAWRRLGVAAIAERFLLEYSDALHSHDQHVLNLIFANRWTKIGLKWNYIEDHYRFRARSCAYSESEIEEARRDPIVVHYAVGSDKPWRRRCRHPRAHLYWEFREGLKSLRTKFKLADPQEDCSS
jgi:lipopolysaccharide biosynthesis glycosyltransferase